MLTTFIGELSVKIGRITKNDPIVRTSIGFHQSFVDDLKSYLELYKETYGDELSQAQLIEEVMTKFMDSDKDFQKFLKAQKDSGATTTASASSSYTGTQGV